MRDFVRALLHPLFVALILGVIGVIFIVQPYDHFLPDGAMLRVLIIVSAVMVVIATVLLGFGLFARAKRRAPCLLVLLPGIAIGSAWGVLVSTLAGGSDLTTLDWMQVMAFNFVFAIGVEFVLASFLLPKIMRETGLKTLPIIGISPSLLKAVPDLKPTEPPADAPHAVEPDHVDILGKRFVLRAIWHFRAEEHYVSVTLRDGTSVLLRGRLADAIAQVPSNVGLQVHRSHWVAKSALADLDRRRDGWRLRLQNGTDIPVARNRQTEVRDWVETALKAA